MVLGPVLFLMTIIMAHTSIMINHIVLPCAKFSPYIGLHLTQSSQIEQVLNQVLFIS